MMLSNEDIKKVLESGELVIDPFYPEYMRGAGLTLHLGEHLLKPKPGIIVDVKNRIAPQYEEILITDEKPYCMQPGEFILGHTYQSVSVGPRLGFFIEGRSTLARVGLTIVQTAMLVYPGHRNRTVTLEVANHGANPVLLYPRMKIARVALFFLNTPSTDSYDTHGKYRVQPLVGGPIFDDEILEEKGKK